MSELTMGALQRALDLIRDKPEPANFVVNIDDMTGIARLLRKEGFRLKRRKTYFGNPGAFWDVYGGGSVLGTIYVDTFRITPRGRMVRFDIQHPTFEIRRDEDLYTNDLSDDKWNRYMTPWIR